MRFKKGAYRQFPLLNGCVIRYLPVLWTCLLLGQTPDFRIEHLTGEQGLSESHVFTLAEDQRGFMWFGTRDGLNRYDGYEFKIYRNDPKDPDSLSNSYVYKIYEDKAGVLWVGTRGGLNRFDQHTERFVHFRHNPEDPNSLSHDTVYDIKTGTGPWEGDLIIATANGGLNRFDLETGQFQSWRHTSGDEASLGSDAVRCLEVGPDGDIWAGTEEGLFHMPPDTPGRFIKYIHDPSLESGLSHNKVMALHLDEDGDLWIGTELGLDRLSPSGKLESVLTPEGEAFGFTPSLMGSGDRGVWIGSSIIGILLYEMDTKQFHRYETGRNPEGILSMHRDRNDTLWLGFYGNGVVHMSPTAFISYEIDEEVSALLEDRNGGLWVGKRGGTLEYRNAEGGRILYPANQTPGLNGDTVTALLEDDRGRIWVGGDNSGLTCYNPDTEGFLTNLWTELPHMSQGWVGSLTRAGNELWVGTDRGLKRVDLETLSTPEVYKPDPGDPNSISAISIPSLYTDNRNGILWIGTWNGGLNRMALAAPGRFNHYKNQVNNPASISANGILSMHQDDDGKLWLGSTRGLNRFDPLTERATSWLMKDGLPANTIYRLLPDKEGYLWLSTPRGLSRFHPPSETFRNFGRHDGLLVEDFRENCGFVDAEGTLVFGGNGGWIQFSPDQIRFQENPPQTVITLFKLDNKVPELRRKDPKSPLEMAIEDTREIQLSHKNRSIELHFAALHHGASKKNRYAHRLENFEEDWVETDALSRYAIYTNLDPGDYTFKVKGSNKDGVWGEPVSLVLKVPAPPWRSWWAYSLYVLFLASLVGVYLRSLHHKLERQRLSLEHLRQMERMKDAFNKDLEVKVKERTRELTGARKKLMETARAAGMAEIASDVLHNVGNNLNSARTSLHLIQEKVGERKGVELLGRIAALFRENEDRLNECIGKELSVKKLPETMERIYEKIKANQEDIEEESQKLHDKVQTIVASLRKQHEQVQARSILLEQTTLDTVLEEALELEADLLQNITCVKRVEEAPPIYLDRLKTLRILKFLIQNAVESMEDAGREGQLELAVTPVLDGGRLEISDNGVGVPEEEHSQLFVHGFSTKKDREGFGLHYSANAMKEMGGYIQINNKPDGGALVALTFSTQRREDAGPPV